MPTKFLKRIKSAIADQYDPHRDERIKGLAAKFYNEMKRQGRQFRLEASVAGLDVSRTDIEKAEDLPMRFISCRPNSWMRWQKLEFCQSRRSQREYRES